MIPTDNSSLETFDINRELLDHPDNMFLLRVIGDSMCNAGILEGDILIIDKSLQPRNNDIVIAYVDGEFTVKYLDLSNPNMVRLVPANPLYPVIEIYPSQNFVVWGVVKACIHKMTKSS